MSWRICPAFVELMDVSSNGYVRAAIFLTMATVAACSEPPEVPRRPKNVAADAVLVGGAKSWWWIKCSRSGDTNTCQAFNREGITLYDERYLPADGGGPVDQKELQIDRDRTQVTAIFLTNGRVLLPSTDFDRHKALLEARASGERRR